MAKKQKNARGFVFVVMLLTIVLALLVYDSNNRLVTTFYVTESEKLPAAFDGFRIVQLSDLHDTTFGKDNADLIRGVSAVKPDIIAITGDMADGEGQLDYVRDMAAQLTDIAPVYYVSGNHEWGSGIARDVFAVLNDAGVTVLRNSYLTLERGTDAIVIAGIDDPNGLRDQKSLAEVRNDIDHSCGGRFSMLLAHRNNPEYYNGQGFDLVICGHAHGGLIRLPFTDGIVDGSHKLFPKNTSGIHPLEGGGEIVISRGLGNTGYTLRILNNPEIVCVELTAK